MRLSVTVKPNSPREGVRSSSDGRLIVSVNAPPREGKANEALIRVLAEHFAVPKSCVRIVHGAHSRSKLVQIDSKRS